MGEAIFDDDVAAVFFGFVDACFKPVSNGFIAEYIHAEGVMVNNLVDLWVALAKFIRIDGESSIEVFLDLFNKLTFPCCRLTTDKKDLRLFYRGDFGKFSGKIALDDLFFFGRRNGEVFSS